LEVPDFIKDLFPRTKFDDNGYGPSVKHGLDGLNGGKPEDNFQSWPAARTVIKWSDVLMRHSKVEAPRVYARNHIGRTSLRELSQLFQVQEAEIEAEAVV
jgi:hypothetical protein